MITLQKELNRYKKLKIKVCLLRADIEFLKTCKKNRLFPGFIQQTVFSKNQSQTVKNVIYEAGLKILKLEIKKHYANGDLIRRELYSTSFS
jgi:hypothetical protein